MVAIHSSDSLDGASIGHRLGPNRIAVFAERPFLLEEPPGLRVAHPQRDELLTAQALDVEFDHRAALRSWPRSQVAAGAAWGGFDAVRQK